MEITGIFTFKDGRKVVGGRSPWSDNLSHKEGDILVCGTKRWRVVAVDRIYQGCFGIPIDRVHNLMVEPIGHDTMPNKGDVLIKQEIDNG